MQNRLTKMLGVERPIVQAPMGWIARAQLASAVSNAGGFGVIETSSGDLEGIRREVQETRRLTDKPFGLNVALAFVRDLTEDIACSKGRKRRRHPCFRLGLCPGLPGL